MSDETKRRAPNPEMEFEHQDLGPRRVYEFLTGLAVAVVLVAVALWGVYDYMERYETSHQPAQNPLVQPTTTQSRLVSPDAIQKFPQPRLEKNERLEINDFLLKEEDTLASYGWVDQKAGVVRIPIERAMELIAQQGLPTTAKAGAAPPAEADQSAQPADSSNLKKKANK